MKKLMRCLLYVTFGMYCLVLLYLLLLGRPQRVGMDMPLLTYARRAVNLIPFRTLSELFTRHAQNTLSSRVVYDNAVGNSLLFFPMGIFLPTVRKRVRKMGRFLKNVLLMVFLAEALQLVLRVGSFDVDDILLNLAGAAAGFGVWKAGGMQKLLQSMQWLR